MHDTPWGYSASSCLRDYLCIVGGIGALPTAIVENVKTLRDKIYHEVFSSLDTAKELVPKLKTKILNTSYDLEIHVDVGEKGETKDMINEVVGVITGNGFIARTKPESYAASSVADKYA